MNAQKDVDKESLELDRLSEAWGDEQRKPTCQPNPPQNEPSSVPTATGNAPDYTVKGEAQLGHPLARAVEIYHSIVQHQQAGLLDDTLGLIVRLSAWSQTLTVHTPQKKQQLQQLAASGVLANVITDLPSNLTFASDNKHEGATLSLIPNELLLRILRSLSDTTTIERFAAVCRKARVLSLNPLPWRRFFADGTVLSLLAVKIFHLSQAIFAHEGLPCGSLATRWISRSDIQLAFFSRSLSLQFPDAMLTLHSKPLGRWNKLEIISYEAVDAEGEAVLFALNYRPFWFSKVKS
ncbi:hypothetical protein SCLCIDRAFT_33225 [Scleroderma citrinum Foug A]|uniref:F-box domain-containing protein n=1 Tax=Scleroderma citrinum Foug A TaxID=1036808 RepID=A0A0C3D6L7_9AGAM|nr:hypothetical protein SCLCIDRAFT_33225 [Scleroderma citrinum Foug A]